MNNLDSNKLFTLLCKAMLQKPEFVVRVTNHVRAVSGHNTLVNYANNGASEKDKIHLYTTCLAAIKNQDWSKLDGQIAAGQAIWGDSGSDGDGTDAPAPAPVVNRVQPATEVEPRSKVLPVDFTAPPAAESGPAAMFNAAVASAIQAAIPGIVQAVLARLPKAEPAPAGPKAAGVTKADLDKLRLDLLKQMKQGDENVRSNLVKDLVDALD